jgi:hypothetical protein
VVVQKAVYRSLLDLHLVSRRMFGAMRALLGVQNARFSHEVCDLWVDSLQGRVEGL